MKQREKQTIENHVWEPLKKHELTPDEELPYLLALEEGPRIMIELLQYLPPGEYLPVYQMKASERNTRPFENYINALRREGLDVGRGDAEYGFKMPLPKNEQEFRDLIIFRRSKKSG